MDPAPAHSAHSSAQAALADIDVDLLDYLQSLTPAERLRRHDQALALARALRAAGIRHYGFDPHAPETTD
jgi:hypothetical protein